MANDPLISVDRWNLENVAFGPEEIRATNAQRFEMEHLDAITMMDTETNEIVGIKNVTDDEFWVRGHIPGRPILPGVIMLEALAQLTSFYIGRLMADGTFIGFGGLEDVKFRRTVEPGHQLVLVGKAREIRRRRAIFETQGWVDGVLVVEAVIIGLKV